jgi:hypothetical protein
MRPQHASVNLYTLVRWLFHKVRNSTKAIHYFQANNSSSEQPQVMANLLLPGKQQLVGATAGDGKIHYFQANNSSSEQPQVTAKFITSRQTTARWSNRR